MQELYKRFACPPVQPVHLGRRGEGRFGELVRKLYNPRLFKAHVSPHEMLQAVVLCSQKRFQITQQGDAIDFLSWLLNSLHMSLNGTKATTSSIVYKTFRFLPPPSLSLTTTTTSLGVRCGSTARRSCPWTAARRKPVASSPPKSTKVGSSPARVHPR